MEFLSPEWAQAACAAWNAGPSAEEKATKLQKYWDWIEDAKKHVNCTLGLSVEGFKAGRPDTLLMELVVGRCVAARVVSRAEAEAETETETGAGYLLVGSYADWQRMLAGYDMGKAVMYRKLRLARGEILDFFKSAYFWKESLACVVGLRGAD
jgi:putative sterol carrier protein